MNKRIIAVLFVGALLISSKVSAFMMRADEPYGEGSGVSSVGVHIVMSGPQPIFQVEFKDQCAPSEQKIGAECCNRNRVVWVDGKEECCPPNKIVEKGKCILPLCDELNCLGDSYCSRGSCICENGNVYVSYLDDPCGAEQTTTYIGCKSNADCNEREYCNLFGMRENGCAVVSSGSCARIEDQILLPVTDFLDKNGNIFAQKKYLASPLGMTWWAAENWCHAQEKMMVSLAELHIKVPDDIYCSGSDCKDLSGNKLDWKTMHKVLGNVNWWVKDTYDSCYAWRIDANERYIERVLYSTTTAYALCR